MQLNDTLCIFVLPSCKKCLMFLHIQQVMRVSLTPSPDNLFLNRSPKTELPPSTLKTASSNETVNSKYLNANVHLSPSYSLEKVSCIFCYQNTLLFVVLLWVTELVTQPIVLWLFKYWVFLTSKPSEMQKNPNFNWKRIQVIFIVDWWYDLHFVVWWKLFHGPYSFLVWSHSFYEVL